jgi:hypothetical protein
MKYLRVVCFVIICNVNFDCTPVAEYDIGLVVLVYACTFGILAIVGCGPSQQRGAECSNDQSTLHLVGTRVAHVGRKTFAASDVLPLHLDSPSSR